MDAMKLFMAIPDRINFLQMGRYGKFSEQTYRNHFENESFDWFSFNEHLVGKHLTGSRRALAIDPSYIPKSGKKTPWIGYFWSGCAGEYKRGLELMGIGEFRAIANGDPCSLEMFHRPHMHLFAGKLTVIVRSKANADGPILLKVNAKGLRSAEMEL